MSIIKEFQERLKADQVLGTYKWLHKWEWQDKNKLKDYINNELKESTGRQATICHLITGNLASVLDLKEIKLVFDELDEEEIQEVITFYQLEKPLEQYKSIKTRINGPESFLTYIPYAVIHELYKRGKVPFDRQIFVACLVRYNVWHGTRYNKELSKEAKDKLIDIFPTDDFSLDILMAIFEMELGVRNAFYLNNYYNIGGLIIALVDLNILDRNKVHLKILEAFNNPNLKQSTHSWVKNVHHDFNFSIEELILHQDKFINLLHHDRNILAVHGLQILKKISRHKSFNWNLFSNNLEGIVYREKFSSGFKLALDLFFKKLKKEESLREQTCINLAPIFLQADHKIQLKAKTIFEITKPTTNIKEALIPYLDSIHSEVKQDLSAFLPDVQEEGIFIEIYKQKEFIPSVLDDSELIQYITNEEDFIFLTSKVLKSQEPLDFELFLESFPRFYHLKSHKSLKPALKQAKRMFPGYYVNLTNKVGAHQLMIAKLICTWLDPEYSSFEIEKKMWEDELKKIKPHIYTATQWLTYFKMMSRVLYLASNVTASPNLPLLSIPSHHNGQIHPGIFLERLSKYEEANIIPHEGDFNTALCRLNRWTSFKNKIITTNKNSEHRIILDYLLNHKKPFNSSSIQNLENIWLAAFSIKNINQAIDANIAFQKNLPWWKAEKSWSWEAGRRYSENYSWTILTVDLQLSDDELKKDAFFGFNFISNYSKIADAAHWVERDMFQMETLYLNICKRYFSYLSDMEADQVKSIMAILNHSAHRIHPIGEAGYLFLVASLFCGNKTIRLAALDWLSQLIEMDLLHLKIFINTIKKILINSHHPIPLARVLEQFNELKLMEGKFIDVLHSVLIELLQNLDNSSLPKGCSKLLNLYYDVIQTIQQSIPNEVKINLEKMASVSTVKKEVKKILSS